MKKLTRSEIKALARSIRKSINKSHEAKVSSLKKKYSLTNLQEKRIEKKIEKINSMFSNKNYEVYMSPIIKCKEYKDELSKLSTYTPRAEQIEDQITLAQVNGNNITTIENLIVSKYTS